MVKRHKITHWLLVVFVLLIAADSLALQAVLSVEEMTVIANPSDADDIRILICYALPESLASAQILYAQLMGEVEATVADGEAALDIELLPLTRQWSSASASWTQPWTNAGGDVDRSFKGYYLAQGSTQPIRIDVTDLVVQWTRGERTNAGLMLKVSDIFHGTFSLPEATGGGGNSEAPVIRVWYLPSIE